MDSAYWFTWYDVPLEARAEYLGWLEARYIPMVLKRDGVLWGAHYECTESLSTSAPGRFTFIDDPAVPGGTQFILIFGATGSKAFLAPTVPEFHACADTGFGGGSGDGPGDGLSGDGHGDGPDDGLNAADRAMLGLRQGERWSVFVEEDRVLGADVDLYPDPAPCIQLGSFNVPADFEDEACAWFARARMPSMAGTPGAVRMRTMVAVSGWARHACLYEFTSAETRSSYVARERGIAEKQPWSDRVAVRLVHMPGSPAVARRIWPPVEAPGPAAAAQMTMAPETTAPETTVNGEISQ